MNFETTGNKLSEISADGVLVFAFEKDKQLLSSKGLSEINKDLNGLLLEAIKLDDFKAKNATIFSFNTQRKILAPKIFVLGLGKKEEF
ncbi:MAG: M17 family peptidase N-terminal domain-containing protein, partial [Candidatus Levybacteria bacterium]|nr:M17 family peptidase N-terminal domain-containing protein [Candidatus Levybacteria bacterium]